MRSPATRSLYRQCLIFRNLACVVALLRTSDADVHGCGSRGDAFTRFEYCNAEAITEEKDLDNADVIVALQVSTQRKMGQLPTLSGLKRFSETDVKEPVVMEVGMQSMLPGFNLFLIFVLASGFCYVFVQVALPEPASASEGLMKSEAQHQDLVSPRREGAPTVPRWLLIVFLLVLYWFFSVAHTFAQEDAAAVHLNPLVPTMIIYLIKLVLALSMYCGSDGTLAQFRDEVAENKGAVSSYALCGSCLAIYDVLTFVALAELNPARYQVLLHVKTVLIAFIWQFVMETWLSMAQWGALLSCIFAAILTERVTIVAVFDGQGLMGSSPAYATLAVMYAVNITGNLTNERFLKRLPLTVNAQNAIMYMWALLGLSSSILVLSITSSPVFRLAEFPKILAPSVLMSIFTVSFLGITTGYVLKYSGNIPKELVGMLVTLTVAAVDWWVLQLTPCGLLDVQAVFILVLGIGLFALLHIRAAQIEKGADGKKPK